LYIKPAARLIVYFVGISLFPLWSFAQQTPPPNPDAPAPSKTQAPAPGQSTSPAQPASTNPSSTNPSPANQDSDKNKDAANPNSEVNKSGTSKDRLFYALPNFLSIENTEKLPPLTTKQKFAVVARGTFDPVQFPWWGFLAGISQAENSEPAYGQGLEGYAKRYATTAADSIVENFMTQAVFASVLHQDPRFFQSSKGGFMHRSGYAISRIFVTRSDSGRTQFNYSEIFGSATAAAISTYSYHPRSTYVSTPTNPHLFIPSDRTLSNTAEVWGTQVGLDTFTIFLKEFWPDIHHKLSKKNKAPISSAVAEPSPTKVSADPK
jgi:hypothetical protein